MRSVKRALARLALPFATQISKPAAEKEWLACFGTDTVELKPAGPSIEVGPPGSVVFAPVR